MISKKKLRYVVVFSFAILSGAMLLQTSQDVQRSEAEQASIQAGIDSEKETIRVLRTEWDYLNNPERLEALAKQYLDINAPSAKSEQVIASPADLPDPFNPAAAQAAALTAAQTPSAPSSFIQPASLTVPAVTPQTSNVVDPAQAGEAE